MKYGKVNPRFRKYFKHLDKNKLPRRVRITAAGQYTGEVGAVINERFSLGQPGILEYGVVFDWDVSGIPRYFTEHEFTDE